MSEREGELAPESVSAVCLELGGKKKKKKAKPVVYRRLERCVPFASACHMVVHMHSSAHTPMHTGTLVAIETLLTGRS